MQLYRWQEECLQAWKDHNRRGIAQVVTGAGKTRLALEAMKDLLSEYPDAVVRIVVPTIPLAWQWNRELLHHVDSEQMRPGFFGGGIKDNPDRKVMIYIVNSARDYLSKHVRKELALNHPVFLICDECHHYQSKENRRIFSFLNSNTIKSDLYYSLGLSATPFGTNNDSVLIKFLGRKIFQYDFDHAVHDGVISPFIVGEVAASFFREEYEQYLGLSEKIGILLRKLKSENPKLEDLPREEFLKCVSKMAHESDMDPEDPTAAFLILTFQRKTVSNLASSRIACAISLIKRLSDDDRILIFCERISQAEAMAAAIRRTFGNICGIYHSELTKEARTRILQSFRDREFRVLVSCRCLDEGIDVPDARVGIVLSSSAVDRQRVQRLGRIVRRASGKEAACLYYIYIRESTDDAAYLQGLENYESFNLRYYSNEGEFSNEIYEYVARMILKKAETAGFSPEQIRELKACLEEGMVKSDWMLSPDIQERRVTLADTTHSKNYWNVMKKVGQFF